jgi:hypothetical protein
MAPVLRQPVQAARRRGPAPAQAWAVPAVITSAPPVRHCGVVRDASESDAKDVAGEIVEHRLFAGAPGGDMEDPGDAPDRVGNDEIPPSLTRQ